MREIWNFIWAGGNDQPYNDDRNQNNEKHKKFMKSYKDLVGSKMKNQITPERSTWNGKFFEDCYLLRITSKRHLRFYATVVKLEPMDIVNKMSALQINFLGFVALTNFVRAIESIWTTIESHFFCVRAIGSQWPFPVSQPLRSYRA